MTEQQKIMHKELEFLVNNWKHRISSENQDTITDFIKTRFREAGAIVSEQVFDTNPMMFCRFSEKRFKNIIASFGQEHLPRIVIGAHYDVCNNPGADDNGTGIVGLLEIARRLRGVHLKNHRIDLVAFANEEPPFFGSSDMGSAHYVDMLLKENIQVDHMICLEMIGVYYEEENTQEFPEGMEMFKALRPYGNFILTCGKKEEENIIENISEFINKIEPTLSFPLYLPQKKLYWLEMSDHINFWKAGFKAVALTDTAFLRHAPGKATTYHTMDDTIEKIDFSYMEKVIEGLANYLKSL